MRDPQELSAWSERRPERSASDRGSIAAAYSRHLPPLPTGVSWSEDDMRAMKAAFIARFDEDLPRTESLMAVAAVGFRIAMLAFATKTSQEI